MGLANYVAISNHSHKILIIALNNQISNTKNAHNLFHRSVKPFLENALCSHFIVLL